MSGRGGWDLGGPGGTGSEMGSHSELTLQHRDLRVVGSSLEQHYRPNNCALRNAFK